jgi:hypothetical protein
MFVDGVEGYNVTEDPSTETADLKWGAASDFFDGKMKYGQVWDRALSEVEINALLIQGPHAAIKGNTCTLYFNTDDSSTCYDRSGNGNNGSIGSGGGTSDLAPPMNIGFLGGIG